MKIFQFVALNPASKSHDKYFRGIFVESSASMQKLFFPCPLALFVKSPSPFVMNRSIAASGSMPRMFTHCGMSVSSPMATVGLLGCAVEPAPT